MALMEIKYTMDVCTDCVMFAANGETDPELTVKETDQFIADFSHRLRPFEWITCNNLDAEPYFGVHACECCGSTLGGDRHEAALAVLGPETL